MALNKEIWLPDLVGNLFADDSFVARSLNHSAFVNFKTVHVPNAGTAPSVTKGRNSFPASVSTRTDYDLTYNIGEFTTDPFRVPNAEEVELSYDKRNSILSASKSAIQEAVANDILTSWVPSSFTVVRTSGDSVAAHLASQTGNRKKITLADVLKIKKEFDKNNIPQNDRYLLLDYEMYAELMEAIVDGHYNESFSRSADAEKGTVGTIYGFGVYLRSTALRTVAAGTSLAASAGATDQAAGLAWQKDCVSIAKGEAEIFESNNDPLYYGDVFSCLVRAGGSYVRNDKAGVVVIAQANA